MSLVSKTEITFMVCHRLLSRGVLFVLVTFFCLCFAKSVWSDEKGVFQLNDGRGHLSANMRVYYFRPKNFTLNSPVLIVLHGNSRTARNYRNYFVEAAIQHKALVLAPKFTRTNYPGSRHYNLGYLQDRAGNFTPKSLWAFPVIDRVFKKAKKVFRFKRSRYFLFGHSAGAQFVHRLLIFYPSPLLRVAVAANAGWYTFLSHSALFPYGLKNAPVDEENLKQSFKKKLIVFLGRGDNDPEHRGLRNTLEAKRQGPHRLARGREFFNQAKKMAKIFGPPLQWKHEELADVGHSARYMAGPAANLMFRLNLGDLH